MINLNKKKKFKEPSSKKKKEKKEVKAYNNKTLKCKPIICYKSLF